MHIGPSRAAVANIAQSHMTIKSLPENAGATVVASDKTENSDRKKKTPRPLKTVHQKKRGPPRPHRKLDKEVLAGRIEKLQRRIERAKGQLEDAERHIDAYTKEAKYREAEAKAEA